MKGRYKLLTGAFAVVLTAWLALPRLLHWQLERGARLSCTECDLEIGELEFGLFPGSVRAGALRLKWGTPKTTEVVANVDRIEARFSLLDLLRGRLHFDNVNLHGLEVQLTEGDAKKISSRAAKSSGGSLDFQISHLETKDAIFTYVRERAGTRSVLHVRDIELGMGLVGNTPECFANETRATATAKLEKSGHVELEGVSKLLVEPRRIDLKLRVRNQNLDDLKFFRDNDGVELQGLLKEGRAVSRIEGGEARSAVYLNYSGFSVSFRKTTDRSAIMAELMNLGASIVMDPRDDDESLREQTHAQPSQRKSGESLVHFILRGWKEGAIAVARSKNTRSGKNSR